MKADDGLTDVTISEHINCHLQTVHNVRKDYTERGLAAIRRRKPSREYEHKIDGNAEARLIRLACSDPLDGHARWTLHLLAGELVTLGEINLESISHEVLRGHECDPLPRPGAVARIDHRYKRKGKQRVHISTEPLTE